jgi:hypothetical protein
VLKAAINQTKDPDSDIKKVSLKVDKLIVNGKMFTADDLSKLPESLNLQKMATKSNGEATVFYSRNSVLSNFYMNAPFTVDNQLFNCTEQYIQHAKATIFDDDISAARIMKANDPTEQSKESQRI